MRELTAGDHVGTVVDNVSSAPPALISLQIGRRLYPLKVVWKCKTCRHPKRQHIETALIEGTGPGAIVASLGEHPGLDTQNIRRHVQRRHSALELVNTRVRLELHARQASIDVEASSSILTTTAVVDEVMHRGFQALVNDMMEVKTSDLLRATAMMQEIEERTGQKQDADFAAEVMHALVDEIEATFSTQEEFMQWVQYINTLPHIRAMFERWEAIKEARENPQAAIAAESYGSDDDEDDEGGVDAL